jgi:hypothetical protein
MQQSEGRRMNIFRHHLFLAFRRRTCRFTGEDSSFTECPDLPGGAAAFVALGHERVACGGCRYEISIAVFKWRELKNIQLQDKTVIGGLLLT